MGSRKKSRKRIYVGLAGLMLVLSGCGRGDKLESVEQPTGVLETEETAEDLKGREEENLSEISRDQQDTSKQWTGTEESVTLQGGASEEDIGKEQSQTEQEDKTQAAMDGIKPAGKRTLPEGWELTLPTEDWGLVFGEPGTQSRGNASAEDLAWYDAYYVGDDSEKVIYLTFDCGYENGNTEPILDALRKHDVKAAFFVVGHFLETAPDLVRRMVEDGHVVGNHTYHHLDMPSISDQAVFQKEMDDVADLFLEITGKELSPFYRPPQGKCNVENLKRAQEMGYYTIFWSLAYVDWNQDDQPSHEEAFDKLTARVHPGAVVLLHNTSQTNGEILEELLTKWEEMGYTFRPLAELVG